MRLRPDSSALYQHSIFHSLTLCTAVVSLFVIRLSNSCLSSTLLRTVCELPGGETGHDPSLPPFCAYAACRSIPRVYKGTSCRVPCKRGPEPQQSMRGPINRSRHGVGGSRPDRG